jgi:hypothetical protein
VTPFRLRPDRAREQDDRAEQDPELGPAARHAVPEAAARHEVDQAGTADEEDREERHDRRGDVEVENPLRHVERLDLLVVGHLRGVGIEAEPARAPVDLALDDGRHGAVDRGIVRGALLAEERAPEGRIGGDLGRRARCLAGREDDERPDLAGLQILQADRRSHLDPLGLSVRRGDVPAEDHPDRAEHRHAGGRRQHGVGHGAGPAGSGVSRGGRHRGNPLAFVVVVAIMLVR